MKIGILGTRGIPNAYGGFEQFAQHLAKGLVEKGHDVSVYNSNNHPYKESTWNGVHIIYCYDPEDKIGTVGQFVYDYNCLRDASKREFDVLLQLGYTSSSVWYRNWPKKATNIVNMDGLEWKRTKYNKPTRRFLKWAERLAVNYGDVLIADSIGIKDYIRKKYQKEAFYIPYGADIPDSFYESAITEFQVEKNQYFLLIARMEPENNIETVILGYLQSDHPYPLVVIGSTENKYGQSLLKKYASTTIRFPGAIYDQATINALRHYSVLYFHGHSVGGTNPSLLEAMACGCSIAAHNNIFNKAILADSAFYFSSAEDVKNIIHQPLVNAIVNHWKILNIEKIEKTYNWKTIINDYESIFLRAIQLKNNQPMPGKI
jgi:glycosyltransferase involved in cell wall biosynthesis